MIEPRLYSSAIDSLRLRYANDLKCVVLFGSRARGDERADSDHDLLLVIDNLPKEPIARMRDVRTALAKSDLRINTAPVTSAEFTRDITPLILDICQDGICLFGEEFFEPWRDRARAATQQAGLHRTRMGRDFFWQFDKLPEHGWELSWDGFHELTK